ncbi:SUMF1/EgtB/PvdO family nonheme iron enzyme [Photobacterium kishitanii]|uniref:SUMF1/EgtB/PvdO family nonheme iron enzyme n=1 Tax=Photobacterium kishitanii TaxID=318456 RepID=UPI000D15CBDF|nr:SUMF1/EgtB/PvdO family nonheme iron enzyme [Photobacterium kishitanii]PSU23814.1 hypothetical protein CTM84_02595 [Photobacterium kishitanii]
MDKPGDLLVFAVGELTQETTKLLQEYRNAKVSIDGKVQLVLATAVDVGLSEDNSKDSQLAAANSANEAKVYADDSKDSQLAATDSANEAKVQADDSKDSQLAATDSANEAKVQADDSKDSQLAAANSANEAKVHADDSKDSQLAAANSANEAKVQADDSKDSQLAAADSVNEAKVHADDSKDSQLAAADSANEAKVQADKALTIVGGAISHTPNSRMKQLMDDNGNFNTMVSIPCFTFDEINMTGLIGTGVHPAFLRQDGSIIPEIWIGAFTASNKSDNVIVQSDVEPWHTINYDDAKAKCVAMGNGWHMMTAMEWSAIALWCLANDFQPNGNTEYGRFHEKKIEFCKRVDGNIPNTRNKVSLGTCGSGPNSWRHDNTPFGISDLNGNLWEWIDGFKLVDNEFYVSSYSGQPESEWEVTDIGFIGNSGNKWADYQLTGTSETLKQMLIESTDATEKLKGNLIYGSTGERIPFRGGTWKSSSHGGLAALNLGFPRTSKYSDIGFRPVFIAD